MDSDKMKRYIEAIKFAAGSLQYKDIPVKKTFCDTVTQLYHYYENNNDIRYLEVAALHIQAYLEMGFLYEEYEELFNRILLSLGTTREIQFPKRFYFAKRIKLNKSQVRMMIKRWPASPKQIMKINEVIEDIVEKVKAKESGIYYYQCAVTNDLYELVIGKNENFFHDVGRGKFYTFED
ncbi:hypothetical protein [Mediterraneibacter agrestimuris]|uniref:hypothetical protein n=1 Tax=Mediterraneibacter agrestimuris TaxID=2941333 RepID=UPI00203B3916|nr:hypothetical protein [Mediterraneibacter agrestimuris]